MKRIGLLVTALLLTILSFAQGSLKVNNIEVGDSIKVGGKWTTTLERVYYFSTVQEMVNSSSIIPNNAVVRTAGYSDNSGHGSNYVYKTTSTRTVNGIDVFAPTRATASHQENPLLTRTVDSVGFYGTTLHSMQPGSARVIIGGDTLVDNGRGAAYNVADSSRFVLLEYDLGRIYVWYRTIPETPSISIIYSTVTGQGRFIAITTKKVSIPQIGGVDSVDATATAFARTMVGFSNRWQIQQAIDNGYDIEVPKGTWYSYMLLLRSGTDITGYNRSTSVLKLAPYWADNYVSRWWYGSRYGTVTIISGSPRNVTTDFFQTDGISTPTLNVTIKNVTIKGNMLDNMWIPQLWKTYEQDGIGETPTRYNQRLIRMSWCDNVVIDNVDLTESIEDGLCWSHPNQRANYLGSLNIGVPNNIVVSNSYIHHNLREGGLLGAGSNVKFMNNIVENNLQAVYQGYDLPLNGLNRYPSAQLGLEPQVAGSVTENVEIRFNRFINSQSKAITINPPSAPQGNATLRNITITDNYFFNDSNYIRWNPATQTVTVDTVNGTFGMGQEAIILNSTAQGKISDVNIERNWIQNMSYSGIDIGSNYGTTAPIRNITVRNNILRDASISKISAAGANINARGITNLVITGNDMRYTPLTYSKSRFTAITMNSDSMVVEGGNIALSQGDTTIKIRTDERPVHFTQRFPSMHSKDKDSLRTGNSMLFGRVVLHGAGVTSDIRDTIQNKSGTIALKSDITEAIAAIPAGGGGGRSVSTQTFPITIDSATVGLYRVNFDTLYVHTDAGMAYKKRNTWDNTKDAIQNAVRANATIMGLNRNLLGLVTLPTGFEYVPFKVWRGDVGGYRTSVDDLNAWRDSFMFRDANKKTYYVSESGNDTNDGLTPATAVRKIQTAAAKSDVLTVRVLSGVYGVDEKFNGNQTTKINFLVSPDAHIGSFYRISGWAWDATYPNLARVNHVQVPNIIALFDRLKINPETGMFDELALATSREDCANRSMTYFKDADTVWANYPLLPSNNYDNLLIGTGGKMILVNTTRDDSAYVEGGKYYGTLQTQSIGNAGANPQIYLRDMKVARSSGFFDLLWNKGYNVGSYGLIFYRIGTGDGFNYHTINSSDPTLNFEINCVILSQRGQSAADQASTLHEASRCLTINAKYQANGEQIVHDVGGAKRVILGSTLTALQGESVVRSSASEMWIENSDLTGNATYDIFAGTDGTIRIRGVAVRSGRLFNNTSSNITIW